MNDLDLARKLELATRSTDGNVLDDETESLHQAYASLAQLLEGRPNVLDEHKLLQSVLDEPLNRTLPGRGSAEGRWAMLAVAASLLMLISLMTFRAGDSRTVPLTSSDPQLAWDDDWDQRLESLRFETIEFRAAALNPLDSSSWSDVERLREVRDAMNSESL